MSEVPPPPDPAVPPPYDPSVPPPYDPALPPPAPRGRIGLAWAAIVLAIVGLLAANQVEPEADPGEVERLANVLLEVQGRMVIGSSDTLNELTEGDAGARRDNARQMEGGVGGSIGQRQRWAVLLADVGGAEFGRRQLAEIERLAKEHEVALEGPQAAVQEALHVLYADRSPPDDAGEDEELTDDLPPSVTFLTDAQRALLVEELGWFGEVALLPAEGGDPALRDALLAPAQSAFWGVFIVLGLGCVALLAGAVGLVIFLVLAAAKKIPLRFPPGEGPHGIYAETFGVWFVLFVGLQLPLAALPSSALLPGAIAVFFLSLVALAWPLQRGIPWETVRRDLGLHGGKYGILEPLFGIAAYVLTLPVLFLGGIVSVVLAGILGAFQEAPGPLEPIVEVGHPILAPLAEGDPVTRVLVVVALCVAAPIVEEIAFRGLLYRHLRDASTGLGRGLGTLASALLNGFLFAAVHPQGIVGLPVLTAIGFGLCIARESRDSILPCMAMHALNNGIVCVILFTALP